MEKKKEVEQARIKIPIQKKRKQETDQNLKKTLKRKLAIKSYEQTEKRKAYNNLGYKKKTNIKLLH